MSTLSPLNRVSKASPISTHHKTPTTGENCMEKSSLKEDKKSLKSSFFQSNSVPKSSSQFETSQHLQNYTASILMGKENTPSPTVKSRKAVSQNEIIPLSPEEKDPFSVVSGRIGLIKPTQKWVDEQIKEIFIHTKKGGSKYLKIELEDILKLLTKGNNISEETSKKIIAKIVNAKDKEGKTPLYYAIERSSLTHIRVLCAFGAIVTSEEVLQAENAYSPQNDIISFLKEKK